jgi:hypothetical protein
MNLPAQFYPKQPVVTPEEWQKIVSYYIAASPDSLSLKSDSNQSIIDHLPGFSIRVPAFTYAEPATTLVKINSHKGQSYLLTSDAIRKDLYKFSSSLEVEDSVSTTGGIVDIEYHGDTLLACDIGVLNPNNGKLGTARNIGFNEMGKMEGIGSALLQGLARPVQISSTDFNNDGKNDFLVCEFGYMTGSLSWMENLGNNKYERHVLRDLPGAIKAYIDDYNKDGLKDFWVLFAQGEEGIFLFTNKGNGEFTQKEVLRFPPIYGSSYFEFADFNKDSYPDIVYTCGDNADYSITLKPYHGVYVFLNDGKNNFTKKYFYHINGCYKAIARDYDNDGDLDIATISFFADYINRPEEGFVYLQNKGALQFDPHSLKETQLGRWLTMDAGDFNKDGKIDLILGNFSIGPAPIKSFYNWKKGPPFIILENVGNKPR